MSLFAQKEVIGLEDLATFRADDQADIERAIRELAAYMLANQRGESPEDRARRQRIERYG